MKTILKNNIFDLSIILDPEQIFPDPGQGTPALVVKKRGYKEYTGTYDCAVDTGELDCGSYILTLQEEDWLLSQASKVEKFFSEH